MNKISRNKGLYTQNDSCFRSIGHTISRLDINEKNNFGATLNIYIMLIHFKVSWSFKNNLRIMFWEIPSGNILEKASFSWNLSKLLVCLAMHC